MFYSGTATFYREYLSSRQRPWLPLRLWTHFNHWNGRRNFRDKESAFVCKHILLIRQKRVIDVNLLTAFLTVCDHQCRLDETPHDLPCKEAQTALPYHRNKVHPSDSLLLLLVELLWRVSLCSPLFQNFRSHVISGQRLHWPERILVQWHRSLDHHHNGLPLLEALSREIRKRASIELALI